MKRSWILVAVLVVAAAAAAGAWRMSACRAWTTDSPAALELYEQGRQAQMKFYWQDAGALFERALELDPQFVAARLALLETDKPSREERQRLIAELRTADRSRLTDRERFLLDLKLAEADGDAERRRREIEAYSRAHPKDPWVLMIVATDAWNRTDWEPAERHYKELLETDPNWVVARNNLGYMAMAQGRFEEAEAQFRTYLYAAPDQANPHDSLGELLVLLGRYDEARAELEEAVAVRPDFCASYGNLFSLAILERRAADLEPLRARVAQHCDEHWAHEFECRVPIGEAFLARATELDWQALLGRCPELMKWNDPLTHAVALRTGRPDVASAIEGRARAAAEKSDEYTTRRGKDVRALVALLEGQRLLAEGRPADAAARLREVEEDSVWWGAGGAGLFKLVARLHLATALSRIGDEAGAQAILARLRAVNPQFADTFAGFNVAPEPSAEGRGAAGLPGS